MAFLVSKDSNVPPLLITPREQYKYEALASPTHIRLLRCERPIPSANYISRSLEQHEIHKCPEYIALSYTWGNPLVEAEGDQPETTVDKKQIVFVDGKTIDITSNLHDALVALDRMNENQYAKNGYMHLWIDAICINQEDLAERSAQVLLMGDIYASSLAVIAWLGEDMSDLEAFISLQTSLNRVVDDEEVRKLLSGFRAFDPKVVSIFCGGNTDLWQQVWLSYFQFYAKRRWFQRAWVIQEFALSRNVMFLCGHRFLPPWQTLLAVDIFLDESGWESDLLASLPSGHSSNSSGQGLLRTKLAGGDTSLSPDFDLSETRSRSWSMDPAFKYSMTAICGAVTEEELWFASLFHWLHFAIGTFASDLRDKVYAIVAMLNVTKPSSFSVPIHPDYWLSVQEVYIETSRILLEKIPNLVILSVGGTRQMPADRQFDHSHRGVEGLPSWAADFSRPQLDRNLIYSGQEMVGIVNGSVEDVLANNVDCCYDASNTRSRTTPALRSFSGNTLTLEGAIFDKIQVISPPTWHIITAVKVYNKAGQITERYRDILPYYEVLGPSNSTYSHTGEALMTALWRTMIGNIAGGNIPASPELEKSFIAFLIHQCTLLQEKGVSFKNSVLCDLVVSSCADKMTSEDSTCQFLHEAINSYSSIDTREFEAALGATAFDRCLYRTSKGVIGLCPTDVKPDDEVWLLLGARVPFVLRSEPNGTDHRLVGETYVHGFMHGEMLDDELKGRIQQVDIA